MGRKPVVLDAGRGAVAFALGLRPRHDLLDLLQREKDFDSVAASTEDGVWVLRGDRGLDAFAASGAPARDLLAGFARLSHGFDDLLLAMPAAELASLAAPGRTTPVVGLEPTPAGRIGSYALVKQLATGFGYRRFACVVRGAESADAARTEHARLAAAASKFLGAEVSLAGWLPPAGPARGDALARTAHALIATATPLEMAATAA
jgi:MinD-like ATPase involved in chromosome partitioning or flagellar assembly